MILERYIVRNVTRPFLAVAVLVGIVFLSYSTATLLGDAAAGLLPRDAVARFVVIKLLIAMEVLLPISYYLGVVVGLGRLYNDGEMTALFACGVSERRVLTVVLLVSLIIATLVAFLSIVGRPWAYRESYLIRAVAEADFSIEQIEGGRFFASPETDYTIYAERVVPEESRAEGVFFKMGRDESLQVIQAAEVRQSQRSALEPVTLTFINGHAYRLNRTGSRDVYVSFDQMTLRLEGPDTDDITRKSKTRSTRELAGSDFRKDVAELQWRLSAPVVALLLALLAVPLSRSPPRKGRHGRTIVAMLACAVFFNATALARSLVHDGTVGTLPGLWWPHAVVVAIVLYLLSKPATISRT